MGNISPRQSKSYHDGLNNHLSLSAATATTTPNRSSWKKQLQILNDTLNIKKFSLRHTHGRSKRYRTEFDENNHPKLSTSMTTQNFHDLIKNNCEKSTTKNERVFKKLSQENHERHNSFKKSLSLFTIKQPLADSTNKETLTKSIHNPSNTIKENDEGEQQPPPTSLNSYTKKELSITQENQIANGFHQHKRRQKLEITTGEYLVYN